MMYSDGEEGSPSGEKEDCLKKCDIMEHRTFDIPFYPFDDISYHQIEKDKNGVRCVAVIPNYCVKTVYVERTFPDIVDLISKNTNCNLGQIFSQDVNYTSNGVSKTLCLIYVQSKDRLECCVRYEDIPLIFADGCLITGEDFTDLSMDQCYALVMSARAQRSGNSAGVSVNKKKDMDLLPRLVGDE